MKKPFITVLLSMSSGRLLIAIVLSSLAFIITSAQVPKPPGTFGNYDGKSPSGLSPGAPAGSFVLSGFDNINLYNGSINFHMPLIQIGGRGSAGYVANLSIERHWSVKSRREVQGCFTPYISPLCTYLYTYWPDSTEWNVKPGYGPGVLQGRQTGKMYYSPVASCPDGWTTTLTRLTFTAGDGTQYELRDKITNGQPLNSSGYVGNPAGGPSRGKVFATADGSSATFISDDEIKDNWGSCQVNPNSSQNYMVYPTGYLLLRDGTRYRIVSGQVQWIRDRNGNALTFSNTASGYVITDSLNRHVTVSDATVDPLINVTRITYDGFGAAPRIITIEDDNISNYLRADYRPGGASYVSGGDLPAGGGYKSLAWLFPGLNNASSSMGAGKAGPTSIILPDDERRYRFYYNPYGELARVELPTGGAMEYDWEGGPGTQVEPDGRRTGLAGVIGVYRRVVERRVYVNGTTLTEKTRYIEEVDGSGTSLGIITVDQLPVSGTTPLARSKHYFDGSAVASLFPPNDPTDYEFIKNGREYMTETYASDGVTLLRKTENNWQPRVTYAWTAADLRLMDTTNTIADGNLVSKQFFSFSPDEYNNQTDIYEHDFGIGSPGALIRHTHTDYKTDGYDTIAGDINNPNPAATIHIRGLPELQTLQDASGIIRAKTTYEYDGSSLGALENYNAAMITGLVNRIGQTQAQGYNPAGDLMRGNVTKVSRWSLANTGLEQSNNDRAISSYMQYDVAGNVVKAKDSNNNETTFDYSDSFIGSFTPNTFAFLKSTTSPNPGATYGGNMPLVSISKYDFSSGKVIETTDPNLKITTFEYNDELDRLTRVIRPTGGGQTKYIYCDKFADATPDCAEGELALRTRTLQSGNETTGVWLDDYVLYDGLGRAKRSAHYEGGPGWSVRENQYDALGRVSQVSNPFFAPTYSYGAGSAWTTSTYDALSRVTRVTTPEGAHVDTSYLGNQVTVADQTGKTRSSITDGLGRLIQVNEAPNDSAYNYQTNYTYDALGNLIRVRQGGFPTGGSSDSTVQFRRFYYDSLSRLVYANNPEQNATIAFNPPNESGTKWTMKYEYEDNGNLFKRTDARGVLTTYGYDALNRNTTVDYSNGTAAVRRYYDVAGSEGGAFTNGKGRLRKVESLNIHPTSGQAAWSRTVINDYDNLGRVTSQRQGFLKSANNWQDFTATRAYDLVSHVLTQSYPSTASVSYNYGASGRTNWFDGGLGGEYYFYTSGLSYNAAGQMTEEQFGMAAPLYHTARYNNRFQMYEVNVGTFNDVNNSASSAYWNRGRLRFFYNQNALNAEDPSLSGTDNNGNVLRQEHWVPTATQTNQINSVLSNVTQYAMPMRDDYEYDPINRITKVDGRQRLATAPGQFGTLQDIYQQAFTYDKFGNRKIDASQTNGTGINNKVYEVNKRNNRLYGQVYDAAGNVINDSYTSRLNARTYDAENRMVSAQTGSQSGYYVYDGDGRRVRRLLSTGEFWQVYGIDGELLAEYQWNGTTATLKKEYGYRDGQLLVVADPTEANADKRVQWLIADHLGTPRMMVDKIGSLSGVIRHDYLPFGEELMVGMGNSSIRSSTMGYQADSVRQKFTGYERDSESNLDFATARHFSSVHGRFTTVDPSLTSGKPIVPQSWNRYSYVLNNPLLFVDPTGLIWGYKNSETNLQWFNTAAAMKDAGYSEYTKYVYTGVDGLWYALDPNSNNYKPAFSEWGATREFWKLTGLQPSIQDHMPVWGSFRKGLFNYATEDYEGAIGRFGVAAVEGGTLLAGTAVKLSSSISAQFGELVFWSGGQASKLAATEFAESIGGKTLEMTFTGDILNFINSPRLWEWGTRRFAERATGEAHLFLGKNFNPVGTWARIEKVTLQQRGVKIVEHTVPK